MDRTYVVTLNDVCFSYAGPRAQRDATSYQLREICLRIAKGESVALVGRNGAGKTSLLKLIAGIYKPDSGSVTVNAERVFLLTLQPGLSPSLTGRDNVILGGLYLGFDRHEIVERIPTIFDFAGLTAYVDRPFGTYSAGMRARLGFSLALHLDPEVMLIDETLSVGDGAFREKAANAMTERILSSTTVVLVSHNLAQVRRLSSKVIWIHDGAILMYGPTEEVLPVYTESL